MKAKETFSGYVVRKCSKGFEGQILTGVVLFLTIFAAWSLTCLGGACVDVLRRVI